MVLYDDCKFDNVMFDPTINRVGAIFDWEMATIGDPLIELGTTPSYWIESGARRAEKIYR